MGKIKSAFIAAVCISLSSFHLYTAGWGEFMAMIQRGIPLMIACCLIISIHPLKKKSLSPSHPVNRWILPALDLLFILGALASIGYMVIFAMDLADRIGIVYPRDKVITVVGIICLLEATRRSGNMALSIISFVFIVYVFVGPYLPGLLYHEGFEFSRFARMLWLSTEGVFGLILATMVSVIYIFILLASFMRETGAGTYIIDFAFAVTGRLKGGPALSAVVASGMFGTVSGSPVANVVGTGTFTIPLMKKSGFAPHFAGAVEAVASCGGYLMPPIMGAGAFIMAELTGIPYIRIALVALIPALFYYFSLYTNIYLHASMKGMKGMPASELPRMGKVILQGGHIFVPLPILLYSLITGYSPEKSGFFAIASLFFLSFLRQYTRLSPSKLLRALEDGARKSLGIMVACASMGIIIAVVNLTGLGVNISLGIETLAGANLFICLVLIMIAAIIFGMGVAPTATYIMLIIMLGSVLKDLGLSVFAAHFFILYFASLAPITPPVALASYTAAGIASADPWRTGWQGIALGLAGFCTPFLFVYYPPLLLEGALHETIFLFLLFCFGLLAMNISLVGYLIKPISRVERFLLLCSAIGIFLPSAFGTWAGAALASGVIAKNVLLARRLPLHPVLVKTSSRDEVMDSKGENSK